ncbi:hypothetical protein ABZW96_33360 [Nocardia sp. NPDC004168]|uniref:hypothetical protein n=1 Tax=unclassified Nocardia TaxID=2637762 RepID=UPI00339F0CEE
MTTLFWIGAGIWFPSVAVMVLSRLLRRREVQVFQASLLMCAVGSVILAITLPAVTGESTLKNVLMITAMVALAILCTVALVTLRRRPTSD